MKIHMYDIKEWLQNIKSHGIKRFKFVDLKAFNLDKRSYMRKAKEAGLLRKVGKERHKSCHDPVFIGKYHEAKA